MAEPLTVDQWSVRIGRDLDGHLDYPKPMGTGDYLQGVSKITFQCTDDGIPGNVTLAQSSGSHLLDHAAMEAVNRLSTLHPLPEGVQSGQHVAAWIVLAQDEASRDRMMKSLRRDAQVANAATAHQIADRRNPADRPAIVIASR
jgi:TonB family protein